MSEKLIRTEKSGEITWYLIISNNVVRKFNYGTKMSEFCSLKEYLKLNLKDVV